MNVRNLSLATIIAIALSAILFMGISPASAQHCAGYHDIIDDDCVLEPGMDSCEPDIFGKNAKIGPVMASNSDIPRFLSPPPIVW
ncbi:MULTISPECIES: hypothetical protein [Yersinia]|uniref:Uncharacterized protein n=1 Tax=Yersinia intermedia TaxID=631 RepID=A0A0H5LX25_YERIN|nr:MULTISPECIES: hypothetical protein [Yersinia]MCB5309255.1 hypothetical protein [Yersinia massiliensis]CRY55708.1 Uncharacterised protein [Yersinia intermedia]